MMDNQTVAVAINAVSHAYDKTIALDDMSLTILKGATVGLIGPDGVGKSTLLSLIAGVKIIQEGTVNVFGKDMSVKAEREALSQNIAFMPQGLGHNLYPTLSVYENVEFHARLFGLNAKERAKRIQRLLDSTGLAPFPNRPAGKLSGGMKQKLSLCCALVHNPDLLILDEPTTGVDPLSRRQFWSLVDELRAEREGMTVLVATAYIDEAENFEYLLAMDDGKLLANQKTKSVMQDVNAKTLEEAYVKLLPAEKRPATNQLEITPFIAEENAPPAIEAHGLTKRFGDFTAVDNVSFKIEKGEIFGFLGSNGCGKSTTMKMLTGLIDSTEGSAKLLGQSIDAGDIHTRMRVGYMSQAFSLYEELTVRQNLVLHAKLYQLEGEKGEQAVNESLQQFDLTEVTDSYPASLSLGMRQRLQLAAACLHHPEVLILDEPTSGVDPGARDMFWHHLLKLSRDDKITIFVSTHFMNEASRCDRISFMHRGRVLAIGTPTELTANKNANSLEDAFVQYLVEEEQGNSKDNTPQQNTKLTNESNNTSIKQQANQPNKQIDNTINNQPETVLINDNVSGDNVSSNNVSSNNVSSNVAETAIDPTTNTEAVDDIATNDITINDSAINDTAINDTAINDTVINNTATNNTATNNSETNDVVTMNTEDNGDQATVTSDMVNTKSWLYWFATVWTFANREAKELLRDKIRLFFAIVGPIILMIMTGWSISFDVNNLPFSMLDQDQSAQSRQLSEYFVGTEYFIPAEPVHSQEQAQQALKSSAAKLVIDVPPNYGRDLVSLRQPEVSFYIDGSLPFNAANMEGYVGGIMYDYIEDLVTQSGLPIDLTPAASVVPRFMYNQDFKSINAVVPSVLMMILMLIPAMMTALGVVREREIGSISNLYASPASVPQYLLGKQLPYVAMGLINYVILVLMAVFIFDVPIKGSFIAMTFGAVLLIYVSTGLGLLVSSFVRTQVAALFVTAIVTLIPTINYSGLLYPLSSLNSGAYAIGVGFPASWYQRISIGGFTKGLHGSSFLTEYAVLLAFALVYITFACIFLKKQEV